MQSANEVIATPLTKTAEVQKLSSEEAMREYPVKIRGVVTFSLVWWRLIFVEDETGGVFCEPADLATFPPFGHQVELNGTATKGAYLPVVLIKSIQDLGPGELPTSRSASAVQLWNGEFDGDLVRVSGHVAAATTSKIPVPFLDLQLISDGRSMHATVLGISNTPPQSLLGSHVEIQGVFGPKINDLGRFIGVGILAARPSMFRVFSNAQEIAKSLPIQALSNLHHATNQLVHTLGIVTLGGTNDFWIGDERGGINARILGNIGVNRGDALELLSTVNLEGREPRLTVLQILASTPAKVPPAARVPVEALFNPLRHGQVVQTEGEFLHRVSSSYGDILVFRDGEHSFEARLRSPSGDSIRKLAAGARVSITGVLRTQSANAGTDATPRILISDSSDILNITPAPWSARTTSIIVNTLAISLGIGLLALAVAHRKLKDAKNRLEAKEDELRGLNSDLERRVQSRTEELEKNNSQLTREIAERKQAQATLAEGERRFRLLVEQVDTIVWEFDPKENRLLYVSPQAARLGYPLEEWLTPGFWAAKIHPEDREHSVQFCVIETEKGIHHELQYRFAKADGSYLWIDDKVAVETQPDGSRLLRGVFIDITEQKDREIALRESEERFAKAFHASPAISAITSFPDGIVLDANERLLQAAGYTRTEVIGHTTSELGLWANPELRKKIISQLEQGMPAREIEYEIINKHGQHRILLGSLERIVLGGRQCILSINQDITDRKLAETSLRDSEERFAKAFHASPTIVVITRKSDAQYVDVNERFVQVMGYSREEAIGRTSIELGIWEDPEQRRKIMSAIDEERTVSNVECFFRTKSGTRHTMLLSLEKIVLGGEPCLLGINNDITELKKAEALRTAQNHVLEMIAQGAPLSRTLERLVLAIEDQAEGMICSLLLLDKDGKRLRHGAAPSLPEDYNRQIDGLIIGENTGSCGTAAHHRKPVVVADIHTDPLWESFRDLAAPLGLRSCWSTPIFDAQQRLLGTFAIYHKTPGRPSEDQMRLIHTATHTAAICIRRAWDEESLRESQRTLREQNDLLHEMEQLAEIGAWSFEIETKKLIWSNEIYRIHELPVTEGLSVEKAINHYAPQAQPLIAKALEEAALNGTPLDLELPLVTARGSHRRVRVQGKAELKDGRPVRLFGAFQDITRRKNAEDALRASEERFAKAFQLSPAITVISRRSDGRYIDINARFTEIMGYTRQEALGRTALEMGLWADPEKRSHLINAVERYGYARDFECDYVDKSGRTHVMVTSVEPIIIAGEECLLSVNHDISDRRRIENGLRALVTSINAAATTDFYIKLAQQLAKLFQTRYAVVAATIPGRNDTVKTLGVCGDGKALENFEKVLPRSPCAEVLSKQIVLISSRASELYPGDSTLAALKIESYLGIRIRDSQQNPLGLIAVMHDRPWNPPPEYETILRLFAESAGVQLERNRSFAALQSAESRFRMAIEHSFDCLALTDGDGICTYVSPAVTRILGYSVDELTGAASSKLALPEDLAAYLAHQDYLKQNIGAHAELEFRVRHRDGTTRWVQIAGTNRLNDPDLKAIVCNFRDITERKHAEIIHRELEVQLRQSQKMEAIGTLAGGVAHDFNNILGTIIGCGELARMDSINNPAALANIDDLLKASHRAKDLVKQILTFSRREEYQRKLISLGPLVAETIRLLRAALPPAIELRSSVATPLPAIHADATLIQQVLMNLVTNAAQAIGEGKGIVEILVREQADTSSSKARHSRASGGSLVMIQVRDNGCGMEPTLLERIFEPFFTTKGPGQGTGLGLSVVHGIISAHGGVIRVESSPDKGSTFTILLPSAKGSPEPVTASIRPGGLSGGHERILIIDDEQPLLTVCEKVLRRAGYQVIGCNDASHAIELFRKSPDAFDIVITDYSMPGQSGADIARKIFTLRPELPIVVCTGYTTGFTTEQALQMGFSEFLHKPVALDQLCLAVRRVLDRKTTAKRQP